MISKRLLVLFLVGLYIFSGLPGIVSAAPSGDMTEMLSDFFSGVWEVLSVPLEAITGDSVGDEYYLAKVMFLVLIFLLVYATVDNMPMFKNTDHTWIVWVISGAVAILATRWLGDNEIVATILLPYSTFGVALTAGIPFVLFFFFVDGFQYKFMRKLAWLFFGLIFLGIFIMRYNDAEIGAFAVWIYGATALAGGAMYFIQDHIDNFKGKIKAEKRDAVKKANRQATVNRMESQLNDDVVNGHVTYPSSEYNARWDHIKSLKKKYGLH